MTKFRRFCDYVLEGGWLLAVVLVTLYFNIYTKDSRIFEPQKALVLRFLVTVMLAVWAVRVIDESREKIEAAGWWMKAVSGVALASLVLTMALFVFGLSTWKDPLAGLAGAGTVQTSLLVLAQLFEAVGTFLILFGAGLALVGAVYAMRSSWKDALRTAMVIPALAYVAVHIISTIASVFPQASLYGGYVRQQGTLTVLSYIGLFFVLAFNLRRREQLDRLITVILVTSIPATLYGIVQKVGIDPLPWMGNVEARVASTMGNAIFIAAYLIMVLALTGYRLLSTLDKLVKSPPPGETPAQRGSIVGKPLYASLLWIGVALVSLAALVAAPIAIAVDQASKAQSQSVPPEQVAQAWSGYWQNLLLFGGVAVLTVALPALVYSVMTLIRERTRPYAHLAGLGVALLGPVLVLFLSTLNLGGPVRTFLETVRVSGFFWGGYMLGLFVLALLSRRQHMRYPWGNDALWIDAVYILLMLQSLFLFVVIQIYLPRSVYPTGWWLYLAALLVFFASCYIILRARIAGRMGYLAQVAGYAILALLQLLCIFLTQSRGPLVGLLAGVFVFALLWPLRRHIRPALITILTIAVVGGALLAVFNLPDTPILGDLVMQNPSLASFVEQRIVPLKDVPYIGRLGRLADASTGTGRVRRLIWFGDEIGTGSIGMILAHPLRTLIGYGPETMHVAYNPYYPPELAHVEKRNASPDRAHNAVIDELVTLGVAGLVAYLFYFLSFFILVWQLLWRAPDPHNQALGVGLFSLGVAHFFETLFGIPIVSTRMYMWIAIGVAVALTFMPPFARGEEAANAEEGVTAAQDVSRRRRRPERRRLQRGVPAGWVTVYIAIVLSALIFAGRVDIKPMQADLLFWQSEQMKAQAKSWQDNAASISDAATKQQYLTKATDLDQQSLQSLLDAISLMPHEDFFYLSLAQAYLNDATQAVREAQQAQDQQQQQTLITQIQQFFNSTERSIIDARDLSPLNTDHYRNLYVLYMNWFQGLQQADKLARAIAYSEQAISLTANNAGLHNQIAQAYLLAASYYNQAVRDQIRPKALEWLNNWATHHLISGGRAGDTHLPLVAQYRQQALDLLQQGNDKRGLQVLAAAELQYSLFLDDRFAETYQALGEVYWRTFSMPAEAALVFGDGIRLNRAMISDSQLDARLKFLADAGQLAPVIRAYQDVAARAEYSLEAYKAKATSSQKSSYHKQAADAYQLLGYIYSKYGHDNTAAIQNYQAALGHVETYDSHKNLALVYIQTTQFDLALAEAQGALRVAKDKTQQSQALDLLVTVGQSAFKAGQQDLAEAACQAALQANPQHFGAHYSLALIYQSENRIAEALAQAEAALQVAPDDKKAAVQQLVDVLRQASGGQP